MNLTSALPPHTFPNFPNSIPSGNGTLAATHLLRWAQTQECPDPGAFTRAVEALFASHCNIHSPRGVDLDLVMKAVLRLCCVHNVTVDSAYATLAIAVCVLVGFATSLDPEVRGREACCAVPAVVLSCFVGGSFPGVAPGACCYCTSPLCICAPTLW